MRECKFHPNINRNNIDEENKKKNRKRLNSCELIQRLYNDEIKSRNEKKENLKKKYKPTFKPKINGNTDILAKKWKQKNKKEEQNIKNNNNNTVDTKFENKIINKSPKKKI